MDLGAYAQIDNLSKIMKDNGIEVPRLRGLRLMKDEHPISQEDIEKEALNIGLTNCEMLCESDFIMNSHCYEFSARTYRIVNKYLIEDEDHCVIGVKWDKIHGKKRKAFKLTLKQARKRVQKNLDTFNKYCGRDDVLYIHARIGGGNWSYYGKYVKDQPWFIERVDDAFDRTYCDIYAKIKND